MYSIADFDESPSCDHLYFTKERQQKYFSNHFEPIYMILLKKFF